MRRIYNKIRLYHARGSIVRWMMMLPHNKHDIGAVLHGMWDDDLKAIHNIKD